MKAGFSLIELLLATAVASLLSVALFTSFYQTHRVVDATDNTIDVYSKAALLQYQLEKDFSGTFIPTQAFALPASSVKGAVKREKKELLKKVFFATQKDKNLTTITCITNNPLQVHGDSDSGKPKPSVARVVYQLVDETKEREMQKRSYKLMRQEDNVLEFTTFTQEAQKQVRAYELLDGIKQLSFEYEVAVPKEGQKPVEGKQPEIEFKKFPTWDTDSQEESFKKIMMVRKVPHSINVKAVLWDLKQEREHEFMFKIPIMPDMQPITEQQPAVATKAGTSKPKPVNRTIVLRKGDRLQGRPRLWTNRRTRRGTFSS